MLQSEKSKPIMKRWRDVKNKRSISKRKITVYIANILPLLVAADRKEM